MREIKFRVFDKDFKKMRIVGADQHDSLEVDFETKKIFYYNLQNGCGSEIVPGDDSSYVLMQYTGLNDKNGKEVYEGDIVKIEALPDDEFYEVIFDCGGFMAGGGFLDDYWNLRGYMFEVVGNKFENPELVDLLEVEE